MAQQKKKSTAKKTPARKSSAQSPTKNESSEPVEDQTTETMDSTSAEDEEVENQDAEGTESDSDDQDDDGGMTAQEASAVAAERQQQEMRRTDNREGVPKGRILGPDDELEFDAEEIEDSNFVRVTEDVYQKTYPSRAMRPSYKLVFRAGTVLTKQQVERIEKTGEIGNAFSG